MTHFARLTRDGLLPETSRPDPARVLHGKDALREWMQSTADEAIAALDGVHFDLAEPIRKIECMIAPTENNGGIAMLRRGYNYVDGNDEVGRLNAGLFFIAFINSPERFAKVHTNMARDDMFVEYLKTTSSSVFLVPPGIKEGQYVGQPLFEA